MGVLKKWFYKIENVGSYAKIDKKIYIDWCKCSQCPFENNLFN